jgi:hypothetical protein
VLSVFFVAIVRIVPRNKSIDQVLFCKVTSARTGSPPWVVAGSAVVTRSRTPRGLWWVVGPIFGAAGPFPFLGVFLIKFLS